MTHEELLFVTLRRPDAAWRTSRMSPQSRLRARPAQPSADQAAPACPGRGRNASHAASREGLSRCNQVIISCRGICAANSSPDKSRCSGRVGWSVRNDGEFLQGHSLRHRRDAFNESIRQKMGRRTRHREVHRSWDARQQSPKPHPSSPPDERLLPGLVERIGSGEIGALVEW